MVFIFVVKQPSPTDLRDLEIKFKVPTDRNRFDFCKTKIIYNILLFKNLIHIIQI